MVDKTFEVVPGVLRSAANSIDTEQGNLARAAQTFAEDARQLHTAQGYLDSYNDVLQEVMRATEDAIGAFGALATNLTERASSLRTTADNYQRAQEAAIQRYNGLTPPGGGG